MGDVATRAFLTRGVGRHKQKLEASVGVAVPRDRSMYGYLSEHHSLGETDEQAGDYAEDLAAQMLATRLNVDFDPDTSYDERRRYWTLRAHWREKEEKTRQRSSRPRATA